MSVTEKQLQEGAQSVLQAISDFAPESIVINDWDVLNRPLAMSPFVIIENSDDFVSTQDVPSEETTYTLRFWLLVALANSNWKDASDAFRDIRQVVVDAFNEGGRSLNITSTNGINARRLVGITPIGQLYAPDIDPELTPSATPDYIAQYLGLEVDLF
jgi:hypothetical protein